MTIPLLSITDLRVALADNPALRPVDGVSFHINSGESVALVGESGCGKSVTSYSVLGLLEGSWRHMERWSSTAGNSTCPTVVRWPRFEALTLR